MFTVTRPETVDVPANLGWRLLAQAVDLAAVTAVLVVVVIVYLAAGVDVQREVNEGWLMELTFSAVVFCYFMVFEGLLSATPGKMVAGLHVTMRHGARLTGGAVLVRNLVRIPDLMFWYVPSIIAVAASPERRSIGDFAARTMVWRRQPAAQVAQTQGRWAGQTTWQGQAVWQAGPPPWQPGQPGQPGQGHGSGQQVPAGPAAPPGAPGDWPSLAADACVAAARNLANAENAYRLMAEREHLRLVQSGLTEAGSDALSEEYVAAWDALAEAVVGLQQSYHRLAEVLAGRDVDAFVQAQQPLAHALSAVGEYLPAASDDDVVAVFRRRLEAGHRPGVRTESGMPGGSGA